MGNAFEVWAYVLNTDTSRAITPGEKYHYVMVHSGEDLMEALAAMQAAQKEHGAGCIRLEWRPSA
jgi:hypothetical protein